MNIVSTMVGITIMGAAAPSVMQMTLAPVEAQARARNFSEAEGAAVAFAASQEGQATPAWLSDSSLIPRNCDPPVDRGSGAYDITCYGGKLDSNYRQAVIRSYRLAAGTGVNSLSWRNLTPVNIGSHQCPPGDEWGLNYRGFNETYGAQLGACVPQVAWSANRYENSDSSKWQYDIRQYADMKGYETHPDFLEN